MKILISVLVLIHITSLSQSETFNLVAEDDWLPYSGVVNGVSAGYAYDIIKAAYESGGDNFVARARPYSRCMFEVKVGLEIGCFDSLKEEKTMDYLYTEEPLFEARILIYGPAHSNEQDLTVRDLAGKTVGITNGYTYGDEFENIKEIKREIAPRDLLNLRKLATGRLSYVLIYEKVADYLVSTNRDLVGRLKPIGIVRTDKLYVSFSKRNQNAGRALEKLNQGLKVIRKNGTYQKIEQVFFKSLHAKK